MRSLVVVAALMVACAVTRAVQAQVPDNVVPLDSGRLVRLHLDDGTVIRGRLLRPFAPDSARITFCRYPAPPCNRPDARAATALAAERIAALEVQNGTRLWRGVAIGAAIGALLGGFTGWLNNEFCDYVGCGSPVPAWVLSGAINGGLWGALFGSQSVIWEPARSESVAR